LNHESIVNVFRCCILTWDFLPVVLPAFLVAGAVAVFVPRDWIARTMGAQARWWISFPSATLSGMVVSMCSCNVVPVAASIYRRGAGIGPAFAFLFAGPAMNLVTAVWVFSVFGWKMGVWRLAAVPAIGLVIGLIMQMTERRREGAQAPEAARSLEEESDFLAAQERQSFRSSHAALLFLGLFALLILGGRDVPQGVRIVSVITIGLLLALKIPQWFSPQLLTRWMRETGYFMRLVLPILLPAVLVMGLIQNNAWGWIYDKVYPVVGKNGLRDTAVAAIFGSIMYFPILTEVPFVKVLLKDSIIGVGPALAILINGPGVSLPGAILIGRLFGWQRALFYEILEMTLGGAVGLAFGKIHGDYTCPCQHGPVETILEEPSSMIVALVMFACIAIAWWRVQRLSRERERAMLTSEVTPQEEKA